MGPYALLQNETPVFLAPMSGVTDAPFRKQVMKAGARVAITEMVAGDELRAGYAGAETRLASISDDGYHVVQLVGRDAENLRFGAEVARESGADVIDINMGCPSRRVTNGLSGSALMRDLDHAEGLIEAVLEGAGDVPVTLKMRLGWDRDSMNAPDLAKRAETLGVQLITVHGRTRQDFYEGVADWKSIRHVVEAVDVPVIANGDIVDLTTAQSALSQSGAAGVMIGRAATGRAHLVTQISCGLNNRDYKVPGLSEQMESLSEQAEDSIGLYGARVGMRMIRKHLAAAFDHWLTQNMISADCVRLKKSLCSVTTMVELTENFQQLRSEELEIAA